MNNKKIYFLMKYTSIKDGVYDNTVNYHLEIGTDKMFESWQEEIDNSKNGIIKFSELYYLSNSRSTLVNKAKEIKREWIKELNEAIEQINSIKIS